jgi:hypothetical protein
MISLRTRNVQNCISGSRKHIQFSHNCPICFLLLNYTFPIFVLYVSLYVFLFICIIYFLIYLSYICIICFPICLICFLYLSYMFPVIELYVFLQGFLEAGVGHRRS